MLRKENKKITNNAISYYNKYKIYWFKPCLKIFCFHSKRGSSNLLVEIIYSTVALRTFVLFILDQMNYCQKEEFLSKQVHRNVGDYYQCFLWCSGEYVFQ